MRKLSYNALIITAATTLGGLGMIGCSSPEVDSVPDSSNPTSAARDVHSYARPDQVAVEHIALDLTVDFDSRTLAGRASLRLERQDPAAPLILDTRGLEIEAVTLDSGDGSTDGVEAIYTLGDPDEHLGSALQIELAPDTESVHIDYRSNPGAEALLWMEPEQTASGGPFVFSQSQAILARTWVPCQDSPGVRMTYEATLRVPPGLMALMSAENGTEKTEDGVYHFAMRQPIPSYLLAIAVGDLEFRPLGDRSGVYAEPTVVEGAAWEFAEVEAMMDATEKLYGPYPWERYDILVLPASFPFGGMENPRLTFATPTIIAGDRSLVSLIAHELAHSWSGNLVTNATWDDFWLNEGFTTYIEKRIMEELYGREYEEMLAALGLQDLESEVQELGAESRDTHLYLDLKGRNPDDGMTDIAYEKGSNLLRVLEEAVGRETWDDFIRSYFRDYAFHSITTEEFLAYLDQALLNDRPEAAEAVQLDSWIFGPGIPGNLSRPQSEAFVQVDSMVDSWSTGTEASELNTEGWTTHQWLHFLRNLPSEGTAERMAELDAAFSLTASGNSEISCEWLRLSVRNRYEPAYDRLDEFLTTVGRRKFLKPLYEDLVTSDQRDLALEIYRKARGAYHSVSSDTIDGILNYEPAP